MIRRALLLVPLASVVAAVALLPFEHVTGSVTRPVAFDRAAAPLRAPAFPRGAQNIVVREPGGESLTQLKDGKLDGHLQWLAEAAGAQGGIAGSDTNDLIAASPPELRFMIAAGTMRLDGSARVQVYIVVDSTSDETLDALAARGAGIERVDKKSKTVQAQVPATELESLAALAGVRAVRLPDYGVVQTGSIVSQGDHVMHSDDVRTTFGIDGTGVSVGVISDGLGGLAGAEISGDISSVDTTTCNVTGAAVGASGAEGTAMIEVLHDVAPGATLAFGNFSTAQGLGTSLDFAAAVTCLADHFDIVVDDIGFYGAGPYDGSSDVSANTAAALNGNGPIRAYFTAVANMARQHYQDDFVDSTYDISDGQFVWSAHLFEQTPGATGTEHAGLNPNPSSRNRLRLQPGGSATIVLEWDDPWGSSSNDYDTFYQIGSDAFFCGFNRQDGVGGNDNPVEICSIANPTAAVADFDIFIGNYRDLAAPRNLDLFVLCSGCLSLVNNNRLDFTTGSSSVPNQSDAGGSPVSVVSVGAVRYSVPNALESFSSRGPSNDGRLKPDLVAPDGVAVTGTGGFGSPFFGTSAAAPHAAGVAALILECRPEFNRAQLRAAVVESAFDLGLFGPDNGFGFGRIDAAAAADDANCGHYTPTPTSPPGTPTPAETPLPTVTPTPHCAPGDTNASGAVNAIDAALALQRVAGLVNAVPCPQGADVDQNGVINAIDAALILQFVAGLIPSLPV